jgi:hypothetical protein
MELPAPGSQSTIDGEIYQLKRSDFETEDAIAAARKHGGFYSMYRLVKVGKPI